MRISFSVWAADLHFAGFAVLLLWDSLKRIWEILSIKSVDLHTVIAVAARSSMEFTAENAGHVVGSSEPGLFGDFGHGQFCSG